MKRNIDFQMTLSLPQLMWLADSKYGKNRMVFPVSMLRMTTHYSEPSNRGRIKSPLPEPRYTMNAASRYSLIADCHSGRICLQRQKHKGILQEVPLADKFVVAFVLPMVNDTARTLAVGCTNYN